MCDKCKLPTDKYIYHADEIIAGIESHAKELHDIFPQYLPWWKKVLIWSRMFKLEDYK